MDYSLCLCVHVYNVHYSAVTKFGLLCELYTRNKKDMNKAEKQEVLEYLRGRYCSTVAAGAMWLI